MKRQNIAIHQTAKLVHFTLLQKFLTEQTGFLTFFYIMGNHPDNGLRGLSDHRLLGLLGLF